MNVNYWKIPKHRNLLIADEMALEGMLEADCLSVLTSLYDTVYTTEDIYDHLMQRISSTWLQRLEAVKKKLFAVNKLVRDSVLNMHDILTEEEASALICAKTEMYDLLIDDPRKLRIMSGYGVYAVKPADIFVARILCREEVN